MLYLLVIHMYGTSGIQSDQSPIFRAPSDGALMIPPWTLGDVFVKRLVSFFDISLKRFKRTFGAI